MTEGWGLSATEPIDSIIIGAQGARTDKHPGNFPEGSRGETRDLIGKRLGVSGRTLEKAEAVVVTAEREPEDWFWKNIEGFDTFGPLATLNASAGRKVRIDLIHSPSIPVQAWRFHARAPERARQAAPAYEARP